MHAAKTQLFTQSLLSLLLNHSPHSSFSATGPLQIITLYHPDDFNSPIVSLNQFPLFPTPFFPNSQRDPLKMQIWEFLDGPVVSAFTAVGAGSITGQGTKISSNKMQICQCVFLPRTCGLLPTANYVLAAFADLPAHLPCSLCSRILDSLNSLNTSPFSPQGFPCKRIPQFGAVCSPPLPSFVQS